MAAPPTPEQPEQNALRLWAEGMEKTFNEHGLTLADDDTAAAFYITVQFCARAIEGSHATGLIHIDPGELNELLGVIRGMEQAPRLV